MGRAVLAFVVLAWALCPAAFTHPSDAFGTELLERLPKGVAGALSIENATKLRESKLGDAVTHWMEERDAFAASRRAWGLFARRLGMGEAEAFDQFLGGQAVLAFGQQHARAPTGWIVLAAVDPEVDVRLRRRTRAVPKNIVHGRAVFRLEEESFLLASLPSLVDGRSVLALAPAEAEWLLDQTLAVSAGKGEALASDVLKLAPTDAVVRGFWKPQGTNGFFGDVERWLWGQHEPMHTLAIWATAHGTTFEIGLSPTTGDAKPLPKPAEASDGVLLDVTGPGEAIVAGVLDRAGLTGLIPEGLTASRDTGELVVRRGPEGVDLGARLPVTTAASMSAVPTGHPSADLGQVRVRELSETAASRAIFGAKAEMAWTVLRHEGTADETVVAVTAGRDAAPPPGGGERRRANAAAIVIEAVRRPSPRTIGLHGSAYPYELWLLLRSTIELPNPKEAGSEVGGFASISALIERAQWAVEKASGRVRGRIALSLREAPRR